MTDPRILRPMQIRDEDELTWDDEADVVVVGFGAAGACAALAAAEHGAQVLIIDRLLGGGDTAISGGAVYFGGGTDAQTAAGYADTPTNMYNYLQHEVQTAVSEKTLRQFCEHSREDKAWLEGYGVRFGTRLWPDKTPFPPDGYHLFFSGSEQVGPYDAAAAPAPRAHKTIGDGMTVGRRFYEALRDSTATMPPVRSLLQARAQRLVVNTAGRVVGVECTSFATSAPARLHRAATLLAQRIPPFAAIGPARLPVNAIGLLERWLQTKLHRIRARNGVVLCTGGYQCNRKMLQRYAPHAADLMAIGFDANGSGIALGQTVGARTRFLGNVGVFRTFVPPQAFGRGMLVDRTGARFTNEFWYAGRVGRDIAARPERTAYLILDANLVTDARREFADLHIFNTAPARLGLATAKKAATLHGLAAKLSIDPVRLLESADEVAATAAGAPDQFWKSAKQSAALTHPPFIAVDMSLTAKPVPATTFSLGGLDVDEATGQVRGRSGEAIAGLYAAGRAAAGPSSNSCVGGLSLADCVFTGRRAGASAAWTATTDIEVTK